MVVDHRVAHMVDRTADYKVDCKKVVRMVDPNSVHKAVAVEDIQTAVDIAVVEHILY
jgi:hypothetical protein